LRLKQQPSRLVSSEQVIEDLITKSNNSKTNALQEGEEVGFEEENSN